MKSALDKITALYSVLNKMGHYEQALILKKICQSFEPIMKEEEKPEAVSLPFKDPLPEDQSLKETINELLNPTPAKTYDDLFDMPDDGDGVDTQKLLELGLITEEEAANENWNWTTLEERIQKYKNSLRLEKRYYIRFGNIVQWSKNKLGDQDYVAELHGMPQREFDFHKEFETGRNEFYEPGMSAYYARPYHDKWMIAIDPYNLSEMLSIMLQRIRDGAIYLVIGNQRNLGGNGPTYGSDTEPLIENVEIIKKLSIDEVVLPLERQGHEKDEFGRTIRSGNTYYEYSTNTEPDEPKSTEKDEIKKWRKEFREFSRPYNRVNIGWPTLKEWLHYHLKYEVKRVYNKDVENPIEFWNDQEDRQYTEWIIDDLLESGYIEESDITEEDQKIIRKFVKEKLSDINLVKGRNSWTDVLNLISTPLMNRAEGEKVDLEEILNNWHLKVTKDLTI